MTPATEMTFEAGYSRLQEIAARVTSDEVPVAEMCDLFAEGKGLQLALTTYLDEQKSRVEAIERGDGIQPFRIVAPKSASAASSNDDFAPGGTVAHSFVPSGSADDDIPF